MANPFEKRATEYLRDDEAFLSIVSPEPIANLFREAADAGKLFDRLVMIIGTPGSGKTTMARLFQYPTLRLLLRNQSLDTYRPLLGNLSDIGAVVAGQPSVLGARLPLESEYREFWEFPYDEELKLGLMTALIQARAVIAWIQNLQAAGFELEQISIVPQSNSTAALAFIGGERADAILKRATEVEYAIYNISAALVPPPVQEIAEDASTAYRPFDVIDLFEVVGKDGEKQSLRPLIILDDAHTLQPSQLERFRRWLARRELKVARWIITRLDALTPSQVLLDEPGLSPTREFTIIQMQGGKARTQERNSFRRMAKDMSGRYLRRMPTFDRRGLIELGAMLETKPETLPPGKLAKLRGQVDTAQIRLGITDARRLEIEALVDSKPGASEVLPEDVRLATINILLHRYSDRTKNSQISLFDGVDDEDLADLDPSRPLKVDAGVRDGAKIFLLHEYQRPYYQGIDDLCDAGSENAEQFLHLAAAVVDQLETKLIRGKEVVLTSRDQDRILRERAGGLIQAWDFPHSKAIRKLTEAIATICVARSLEVTAPLGHGAGGVGVDLDEWEHITTTHPKLAQVLQFAIAYNALNMVPEQNTKSQKWCLLELTGTVRLHYGLTLNRGGWVPTTLDDLSEMIGGEHA
ncbi:hypothetical protein [Leifsonia sp. PS1209]|uniref:hypothetical protein n=1 Tax=Leifsonia sp. PS1209 TaxID=2724914 RepID=UPI001442B436|nr:hypothetical protein [Leifsonia sp. PS1209]QIZ99877.1 hypothetical protein HF024_16115 [Leifsonia sp. PS1209]